MSQAYSGWGGGGGGGGPQGFGGGYGYSSNIGQYSYAMSSGQASAPVLKINPKYTSGKARLGDELPSREKRLNNLVISGYHCTNEKAALAIVSSQTFKCGSSGMVGGGIYFAETMTDARRKSQNGSDVMLVARVTLGHQLPVGADGDRSITYEKLQDLQKDSVLLLRENGLEYVVYKSDQVTNIRLVAPEAEKCGEAARIDAAISSSVHPPHKEDDIIGANSNQEMDVKLILDRREAELNRGIKDREEKLNRGIADREAKLNREIAERQDRLNRIQRQEDLLEIKIKEREAKLKLEMEKRKKKRSKFKFWQ